MVIWAVDLEAVVTAALEDLAPAAALAVVREEDLAGVQEAALAEATVDQEAAVMAPPEDLEEVADLAGDLAADSEVAQGADLAVVQEAGSVEATEEQEDTAAADPVDSIWAAQLASVVVLEAV